MTQTFRSRDDQVDALAKAIGPEKLYSLLSDEYRAEIDARALQHILEAEARGAAEERSKSVEGQEPVAWLYEAKAYESGLWVKCATAYEPTVETTSRRNIRPLYTRPANVAALEARVKELEAEKSARDKAREHNWFYLNDDPECTHSDVDGLLSDVCPLEILKIAEAADVRIFYAFMQSDGEIYEFYTEEEALNARAVLTREGGV